MSLVVGLHEVGVDDLPMVGGKAANLGVLLRAGLPVPPGFCVTTQAYRRFVDAGDLAGLISRAVEGADPADPDSLEVASSAIRAGFAGCTVPSDVAHAVVAAHARLAAGHGAGEDGVAVRSSATAEDLSDLSFAGQQDTFLHVVGADPVLDAVVRCWASLWTARAVGYRIRNRVSHLDVWMAVVVQQMVPAEAAGVLFTADPLTGRRADTVVDATLGLGEALVSGQVEPDHYVVDPAAGRVVSKVIGAKAVSVRGLAGGGTVVRAETGGDRQALPDEQILALALLGRRAADVFGSPQDLEWVWSGQDLFVVQSRAITSLYPLPAGLPDEPVTALFAVSVWQGMLDPFTPLGQDVFAHLAVGLGQVFGGPAGPSEQRVFVTAGERLFVDIGPLLRTAPGREVARAFISAMDPPSAAVLEGVLADPRFAVRPVSARRLVPRLARGLAPLVANVAYDVARPVRGRARIEARIEAALAAVRADCASSARDLASLVLAMRRAVTGLPPKMLPLLAAGVVAGQAPYQVMLRRVPAGRGQELVRELSRGLPHNVTTEMDLALWHAVAAIRADAASLARLSEGPSDVLALQFRQGRLPAPAQQALTGFLARYGLRGVGEIDTGRARWGEDPSSLLEVVRAYLQIPEEQSPQAVFDRGAERAEQVRRELVDRYRRTRGGLLKAALVDLAVRRYRALGGLRETPKFFIVRMLGLYRTALLGAGEKLVEAGILDEPDDVVFLRLAELDALARAGDDTGWKALVADRRERYARELRRPRSPRFLLSDGTTYYEPPSTAVAGDDPHVLRGSPVSAGSVTGSVRVVSDPHHAGLRPGEIMVCRATDPAWTPLFLAAGGLVLEVGGMMAHGSVVAREYGIPAVVGVAAATRRLCTGQRVTVDGSSGTVTVLGGEPASGEAAASGHVDLFLR